MINEAEHERTVCREPSGLTHKVDMGGMFRIAEAFHPPLPLRRISA